MWMAGSNTSGGHCSSTRTIWKSILLWPARTRRQGKWKMLGAHRPDCFLRETDVVVVGIGHRTHDVVRQPVQADCRQHHKREPAMCAEKNYERSHNSVKETMRRPQRRFALFLMHHRIRAPRFLCKPGRDHSNGHTCAVNTVGSAPAHG